MPLTPEEYEHEKAAYEKQDREKSKAIRELLEHVASGKITVDEALRAIQDPSFLKRLLLVSPKLALFKMSIYGLDAWRRYCRDAGGDDRLAQALRPIPLMECGRRLVLDPSEPVRPARIGKNAYLSVDVRDDGFTYRPLTISMGAESTMRLPGIFGSREYEFYCECLLNFLPAPWHPDDADLHGCWKEDHD